MKKITQKKVMRTQLTNSNSEATTVTTASPVPDTFELEVEVDQENMTKALGALTAAGVVFKLKAVIPTALKNIVSVPSACGTPTITYIPTIYPWVIPSQPSIYPWQSPFYYDVICGVGNTTGCLSTPVNTVTSTCHGYPPGTQSSYTGGIPGRSNCSCDDCTPFNDSEEEDVYPGCGGNYDDR